VKFIPAITFLFLTFLPKTLFAADNFDNAIGYQFITSMINISEEFVLTLFEGLAESFRKLFHFIAVIMVLFHTGKWLFGRPDIVGLIKLFISIVAVNSIVFSAGVFEEWLYRPVMQTIYELPAYVISLTQGSYYNIDALKDMLISIDKTIEDITKIGGLVIDNNGVFAMGGNLWLLLQGVVLNILYFGLYCVFIVMFTIGIVAAHVMLATMPFAISLIPFERLRGLSFNTIRAFFSYSLIPFFVSIAMALTLSALTNITDEAQTLIQNGDAGEISNSFLLQAIVIAIFSWFFHIKASEFSSQVVGGAISNFGQNFATGVGVAAGSAKAIATSPVRMAAAGSAAVRKVRELRS